jgi:hypothetical protein
MDTDELTQALRAATADLEPRHGFTAAVLRGGRRRRIRTRAMIITGTAVLIAIVGTGLYLIWHDPPPHVELADDPRLTQPTRGDLAGDQAFVDSAARAWRDGLQRSWNGIRGIYDDLRGQPHVYWAGTTPAGPAAVVLQQAYLHPRPDLNLDQVNSPQTLVGLVATDPVDGVLKLVYDQYPESGTGPPGYFQFGPSDRTILVVDRGTPLFFSPAPLRAEDGQVRRDWQQMAITDGVAVAQLPEGGNAADARVVARATAPGPDENAVDAPGILHLEPSSRYLEYAFRRAGGFPTEVPGGGTSLRRLQWYDEPALDMRVGRPFQLSIPAQPQLDWMRKVEDSGLLGSGFSGGGLGAWFVRAGLNDGRVALVSELQLGNDPSQIYAVLLKPDGSVDRVIAGGVVDPVSPLPVRLRMPDRQGWVVADYGAALSYRTAPNAAWQDAGYNAALLPDDVTEVRVTRHGTPTPVALPR